METTIEIEISGEEIELTVTFHEVDEGWEEEVDLCYGIEMIECGNNYDFAMKLHQQDFYNQVREMIINDQSFLDQADAINYYERY